MEREHGSRKCPKIQNAVRCWQNRQQSTEAGKAADKHRTQAKPDTEQEPTTHKSSTEIQSHSQSETKSHLLDVNDARRVDDIRELLRVDGLAEAPHVQHAGVCANASKTNGESIGCEIDPSSAMRDSKRKRQETSKETSAAAQSEQTITSGEGTKRNAARQGWISTRDGGGDGRAAVHRVDLDPFQGFDHLRPRIHAVAVACRHKTSSCVSHDRFPST